MSIEFCRLCRLVSMTTLYEGDENRGKGFEDGKPLARLTLPPPERGNLYSPGSGELMYENKAI
jgi:hypothetical protein